MWDFTRVVGVSAAADARPRNAVTRRRNRCCMRFAARHAWKD